MSRGDLRGLLNAIKKCASSVVFAVYEDNALKNVASARFPW
jgi:hypothetical protein